MLLDEVKRKKEYKNLDDDFVSRVIVSFSGKYELPKQKKELMKVVRAKLRDLYGAFRTPLYRKKEKLLESLAGWDDKEGCRNILGCHLSTKERIDYYDKLYKWLRSNVEFSTVLDIGCGFNVFSMPWLGQVGYYGIEVNKDDVDFCNTYMYRYGLTGGVRWGDVLSFNKVVKTDIVFLFKVLEGFEALERGFSEKMFAELDCDYALVSFATKSLGGKKTISERRLKWFKEFANIVERKKFGTEVYFLCKLK